MACVHCPECGSSDVDAVRGHRRPDDVGPGEWADHACNDCQHVFPAVVPEPNYDYVDWRDEPQEQP